MARGFREACRYFTEFKAHLEKRNLSTDWLPATGPDMLAEQFAKITGSMQDHANAQKAQVVEMNKRFTAAAGLEVILVAAFCWNHKRALFQKWFTAGLQVCLEIANPTLAAWQRNGNGHDNLLFAIFKEFSNLNGSYAKGAGLSFFNFVQASPEYAGKYRSLLRHVGSRHDVTFENSMIVVYMWDAFQAFFRENRKV